jgi:hypothetical protein
MNHGVPGPSKPRVRPEDHLKPEHPARKHGTQRQQHELPAPEPDPLPVYLVERKGDRAPKQRRTFTQCLTVVAAGGEPTRVCSEDAGRVELRLFNEAASGGSTIRIAGSQAALAGVTATAPGDGVSAVPQQWSPPFLTQGDLWAVVQGAAPVLLSVMTTTEVDD